MSPSILPYILCLLTATLAGQMSTTAPTLLRGRAPAEYAGKVVYLDIIDRYDDFKVIGEEQIISSAGIDSSGNYAITAPALPRGTGFYRLRFVDPALHPPVSMNFMRRHYVHFAATPGDTLDFAGLQTLGDDPTNTAINRFALELDALNEEELAAESDRLKALIDQRRTERITAELDGAGPAYRLFLLGQWPYPRSPSAHQLAAGLAATENSDLRETYLNDLQRDLDAILVDSYKQKITHLQWIVAALSLLSLLLAGWHWKTWQRPTPNISPVAPPPAPEPAVDLSPREEEVLRCIVAGRSNKEIAAELFISTATVKGHINSIYTKAGLKNRKEARVFGSRVAG